MIVNNDNDHIDFAIKKLKGDVDMLELAIWERDHEKINLKNKIQDMEDMTMVNLKEIAVLEHTITVLEGLKK